MSRGGAADYPSQSGARPSALACRYRSIAPAMRACNARIRVSCPGWVDRNRPPFMAEAADAQPGERHTGWQPMVLVFHPGRSGKPVASVFAPSPSPSRQPVALCAAHRALHVRRALTTSIAAGAGRHPAFERIDREAARFDPFDRPPTRDHAMAILEPIEAGTDEAPASSAAPPPESPASHR